jgi:hypothetical protein
VAAVIHCNRWWTISLLGMLATMAGCDLTGQYDKKFHEALDAAAKRAVFDLVRPDFTDAIDPSKGVGVKLRLPVVFDSNSKVSTQLPIPVPMAGGVSTYILTRKLDDDQGKWADCTVSIVAVPKGDQKGDTFQSAVTKGLSALTPNAKWDDVSVPTPSGQTTTLKRFRLDMSQLAPQMAAAVKAAAEKGGGAGLDMHTDMYLIDAGSAAVMISWAVPGPQAKKYNLDKAIEASMGTVEVTAPPDAGGKGARGPAAAKAPGCI